MTEIGMTDIHESDNNRMEICDILLALSAKRHTSPVRIQMLLQVGRLMMNLGSYPGEAARCLPQSAGGSHA